MFVIGNRGFLNIQGTIGAPMSFSGHNLLLPFFAQPPQFSYAPRRAKSFVNRTCACLQPMMKTDWLDVGVPCQYLITPITLLQAGTFCKWTSTFYSLRVDCNPLERHSKKTNKQVLDVSHERQTVCLTWRTGTYNVFPAGNSTALTYSNADQKKARSHDNCLHCFDDQVVS